MLGLIVFIIVVGVLLWLVNTYVPMDWNIKNILNAVVVICLVLYLLSALLGWGGLGSFGGCGSSGLGLHRGLL